MESMESKDPIMVVDDEPLVRTLLRLMLAKAGYPVVEMENGETALKQMDDFSPQLIVLDVMMPVLDGFAVCKKLKSDEKTADIPVIMLSARSDPESIAKGLDAGASRYLTKPIVQQVLVDAVSEVLGGSAAIA